jgi:hypothetical protein
MNAAEDDDDEKRLREVDAMRSTPDASSRCSHGVTRRKEPSSLLLTLIIVLVLIFHTPTHTEPRVIETRRYGQLDTTINHLGADPAS